MRLEYIVISEEYDQLLTHIKSLEDRGLWRRVAHIVSDEYFEKTKQGITFVYQKLWVAAEHTQSHWHECYVVFTCVVMEANVGFKHSVFATHFAVLGSGFASLVTEIRT